MVMGAFKSFYLQERSVIFFFAAFHFVEHLEDEQKITKTHKLSKAVAGVTRHMGRVVWMEPVLQTD